MRIHLSLSVGISVFLLNGCDFDSTTSQSKNNSFKPSSTVTNFNPESYGHELTFVRKNHTKGQESFGASSKLFDNVVKFDYPDDGVEIGQGWNSFTERGTVARCVEVLEVPIESSTFESDLREIRSTYSLEKDKSISGKVSGSFGGFSGGASSSYSKKQKLNTEDINVLFSFRSNVASTKAIGVPTVVNPKINEILDATRTEKFSELAPEAQVGIVEHLENFSHPHKEYNISLSSNARKLLEKKKWQAFQNLCGNGFVSAIHRGTDIDIVASYKSKKKEDRKKFRAEASGGGFGVKASVTTTTSKAITSFEGNTSFKIYQTGGRPVAPPEKFSDLRAILTDANKFVQNPAGYEVTITPYSNLGEYPVELGKIQTPDKLIRLADYYVVLRDIFDLVSRIHLEAISTTTVNDDTDNYSRKVLNEYGGEPYLRKLKDTIQLDLALIEDGIYQCLEFGTDCSESDIKTNLLQLIKNEDELDSPSRSPLAKKYGEKSIAEIPENKSFVDESVSNFESTFGGAKNPFSDAFFLQIYTYLSQIPLNKETLPAVQVTKRANPAQPNVQLINGIYSEYLNPWRSYFCSNLMSDTLCVNEDFIWGILADSRFKELDDAYVLKVPRKVCTKRAWYNRSKCRKYKTVHDIFEP